MKDTKIQWHPGFVAAMNLELAENRNDLVFEKEHNLNTKPLEIDLLVIKKDASVHISNEIGEIFRGHNIIEYKSPGDHLDIDTFYKTGAYASLYKSYGKTVDGIKADDITVSIVRETKPEGLFGYFREHGITVTNPHPGIYYIADHVLFPTQIIVTEELDEAGHTWLRALSEKLGKQELERLLADISRLTGKTDREFADSVLEVSVEANRELLEEMRGDDSMSQALLEIMEPVLLEREEQAKREGRIEGRIEGAVENLRDFGQSDDTIKTVIMKKYHLSEQEAERYL